MADADAAMRPCQERRIAEQHGAAQYHACRVHINDALKERRRDQFHHLAELRRQVGARGSTHIGHRLGTDEARRNAVRMVFARLVGHQAAQFVRRISPAVPNDIVTPPARALVAIGAGDGIAQHVLARRQAEGVTRKQRRMGFR